MSSAYQWHGIGMEQHGSLWIAYGWPAMTQAQAHTSPSSRAEDAPVLPPAPARAPDSARIEGLSPAKVWETSETGEKQAGNSVGLIMPVRLPVSGSPQAAVRQALTPDSSIGEGYVRAARPGARDGAAHV